MSVALKESRPATATATSGLAEALLPFIAAAVVYLTLLAVGSNLLNDPDSYWHIASGKLILATGFPWSDPFSFTFAGSPWIAKEWLSQVAYFGAWQVAGWSGMVVLAAAAIALAFGLLARFLQEKLAPLYVAALLAIAFLLASPHAVARPHVLALPVLVAWVAGLVRANDAGRAPPFLLLPLMIVWANLHGSFLIGLALTFAIGLDAVVSAETVERRKLALIWVRFAILAVLAACITPYGPYTLLAAFKVLGLGSSLSLIGEWRPADFSAIGPLEVALLLGFGGALLAGVKLPPVRILILLGLIHLALSAERNGEILGLIAPIMLAAPLARQFAHLASVTPTVTRPAAIARAVVIAGLAGVTFGACAIATYRPADRITPAAAVAALQATDAGPLLNDYDFGGYLVYAGVPTFIDGRTELYGAPFLTRYYRAATLADIPGFVSLLDEFNIGATLFAPTTPAAKFLDTLPGWERLHADDVAVVHVRTRE